MPRPDRAAAAKSSSSGRRKDARLSPFAIHALTLAFVVSGAAGLIFELVWFYQASLVLGNTVWAGSIVLSSFMAGLGLGNLLVGWQYQTVRSPLRVYAALEMIVGMSGVAVSYALPQLGRLLMHLAPVHAGARLVCPPRPRIGRSRGPVANRNRQLPR
jgi:predicted membrane-bound spermidine synthase